MTQPSRALSLAAFVEVLERISEDRDCQHLRPSCAHWRRRDRALWGWFVLWVNDPDWKVSECGIQSLFEWVVEVPGPVGIVLSLLHGGGSAQVYVRVIICSTA